MISWVNFFIVICAQFLVFLFVAHKEKLVTKIRPVHIVQSVLLGIVFGVAFDLLVGRYLGIFTYALQFDPLFLVVNGALSYGIWMLTIYCIQSNRILSFCAWTIGIGLFCELANYFFPVWSWTFGGSFWYQEAVVILVAYCGLGILTKLLWLSVNRRKLPLNLRR